MSIASKRRSRSQRSTFATVALWVLTRVLLPLVVLYGLLWWRADAILREQIEALRPFMDVQRGITVLGLNGDIGVRDLRISPVAGSGAPAMSVFAERAVVQTPGLPWLAKSSLMGLPNEVPSRLGLALTGARVEGEAALAGGHVIFPFDLAGCEPGMSPAVAQALGLDSAPSDFSLLLLNDRSGTLRVEMAAETAGMVAVAAQLSLEMGNSGDAGLQLATSSLKLLSVEFQDRGFVTRRNVYCSEKLGLDEAQFVARHVQAVQASFASDGVAPGAAMTQAYTGFSTSGGRLRIQAVPLRPGPLAQLASIELGSLNLFFDATVKHDDNFSAPLVFVQAAAPPAADGTAAPAPDATPADPGSTPADAGSAPAAPGTAPAAAPSTGADPLPGGTIEYARLPEFLGREIEVDTTMGTRRRGVLTGASSISLVLKLAPADGGFALSMPKSTIASVRLATSTSDAPESQANAQAQ